MSIKEGKGQLGLKLHPKHSEEIGEFRSHNAFTKPMPNTRHIFAVMFALLVLGGIVYYYETTPVAIVEKAEFEKPKPQPLQALQNRPIHATYFNTPQVLDKFQVRKYKGESTYSIITHDALLGPHLLATSEDSSSMLYELVNVEINHPITLSWEWMVRKFPLSKKNETFGAKEDNDFAFRIYVMFKDINIFSSKVIQYIWDDHFDAGTWTKSPYSENVGLIVVRSSKKSININEWVQERRNIHEDYELLFGHQPDKPLSAIGFMSDSDNTQSSSEGILRNLVITQSKSLE